MRSAWGPAGAGLGALAVGWVRHRAGGPVQVLAAGPGLVGSEDGHEVLLTLPGGARAQPLPPGELAALMTQLPSWRAIGGISDGLRGDTQRRTAERPPPSLEECLLAVWPGPFGWLLVAEPVRDAEILQIAEQVARREEHAAGQSDRFPERAVAARRLHLRHAELRQGLSTGLWRVRLAAGGTDPDAAARVAGLVCASADLAELPYALAPAEGDAGGLRELMEDPRPAPAGGDAEPGYPCYAGTELVAVIARPPDREVPGVRLALRPDFDVTQEHAARPRRHRGGRDPGPQPPPRGAAGPAGRVAEPARVRLRRHRCGQVADGARPARGRHQGRDPVAGGGAGQGRVPADGRPPGARPPRSCGSGRENPTRSRPG